MPLQVVEVAVDTVLLLGHELRSCDVEKHLPPEACLDTVDTEGQRAWLVDLDPTEALVAVLDGWVERLVAWIGE